MKINNMKTTSLTVALVQQACSDSKTINLEKITASIKACKKKGAQLVLLPELHTTRYFCQTEDYSHFSLAEAIPGPTTQYLSDLAKTLNIVIVGSDF